MKTHIFQAHTMASAVAQVKVHLGPDALILGTRTVRTGGLFNLSKRKLVEITAACEPGAEPAKFHGSEQPAPPGQPMASNRVSLPSMDVPSWLEQDKPIGPTRPAGRDTRLSGDRLGSVRAAEAPAKTHSPQRLSSLFESLVSTHIAESLAKELLRDLPEDLDPGSPTDSNPLLSRIERMIPTAGPIQPGLAGKPRIVSFIGPTGVGKTTTIAKLAAQYKLQRNTSVALLTIDTYRIAAVDQLRTYADIIDVPFSVVLTPDQLSEQLTRLSDYSLVFIDTTGRSPNNHLRLAELRSFHQVLGSHQTHLVLSATAAYRQIATAIEKFSPLGIDQLLLTKLDEVVCLSPVLNIFADLASRSEGPPIPLSYVTVGQDVPDDIEVASSRGLAIRILGEHRA